MSDGDERPAPVEIDRAALSDAALAGLIEEFVTRDGTDYGASEKSTEEKAARVRAQIASGEVRIVFDPETESANLVLAREWPGSRRR